MSKKKKLSLITVIISMVSLIGFFIWGWIEGTYSHAWLVFFLVPIGGAIAKLCLGGGDDDDD